MSNEFAFTKLRLERREAGVRLLTLDDPAKRNAIGPQLRTELGEARARLASDDEARVLIVAGEGTAFCAGADLLDIFDVDGDSPSTVRERALGYYASFLWIRDLPYPTIAAVNGPAIGAGLNLALVCDIIVAGPDAKFGATFSRLGLHPGGGCTHMLVDAVGARRALATLLLGRNLGADDAYAQGLADAVVEDPLAQALELAGRIGSLRPSLACDIKNAVGIASDSSFEATLGFESWAQAATAFNPGVVDGIRAAGRSTRS